MKKALMIIVICLSLAIFLVPSTSQNVSALTLSDYTLDETKDVISLLDLTIGGLSKQEVIRDNENVSVTFDFNNPNGSLVFKFKYDLIDDNTYKLLYRIISCPNKEFNQLNNNEKINFQINYNVTHP